jgi:uncharacterized membrane protein
MIGNRYVSIGASYDPSVLSRHDQGPDRQSPLGPRKPGCPGRGRSGEHPDRCDLPGHRGEANIRVLRSHHREDHPDPPKTVTRRWVVRSSFALAIAAVAVSGYLTIAHFTSPHVLACSGWGTINCSRVTKSAQSRFLGIPVAILGLAWSIAIVGLCVPAAWKSRTRWIQVTRIVFVSGGMLFVLWLLYAELFVIRAICLWCSAMHMLTFALFMLVALFGWPPQPETREA